MCAFREKPGNAAFCDRITERRLFRQAALFYACGGEKGGLPVKRIISFQDIDKMDGHDFEYFCAEVLKGTASAASMSPLPAATMASTSRPARGQPPMPSSASVIMAAWATRRCRRRCPARSTMAARPPPC